MRRPYVDKNGNLKNFPPLLSSDFGEKWDDACIEAVKALNELANILKKLSQQTNHKKSKNE